MKTFVWLLSKTINPGSFSRFVDCKDNVLPCTTYKLKSLQHHFNLYRIEVNSFEIEFLLKKYGKDFQKVCFEGNCNDFYIPYGIKVECPFQEATCYLPDEHITEVCKILPNSFNKAVMGKLDEEVHFKYLTKPMEELDATNLEASSMTRVLHWFEDQDTNVGVVSACVEQNSEKITPENKQRTEQLKKDIRKLGYGYIPVEGGYIENRDGNSIKVKELSFIIPNILRKEIVYLCKKYNQNSVLYKEGSSITYLDGKGVVVDKLKTKLNLNQSDLDNYYSKLVKGKNTSLKFGIEFEN